MYFSHDLKTNDFLKTDFNGIVYNKRSFWLDQDFYYYIFEITFQTQRLGYDNGIRYQ